jgi:hypothetical protein
MLSFTAHKFSILHFREASMDPQIKSNLTSEKHWVRLVFMLLFAVSLYVALFLVVALIIVQFVFALITGADNAKLRELGYGLSSYIRQILMFLTFNSETKPYPFSDWPNGTEEFSTTAVLPDKTQDDA